ncbi:MAG: DUF1015 domain-containing protein [Oscillospiraceae bacterium]|nr:DUF1015 domain-containing protein [Oscillospiraceae bacterium]
MKAALRELGLASAGILLPAAGTELEKFAVIACDQFSSRPEYWQEAERIREGAPSALDMIFPEAYLMAETDEELEAKKISAAMQRYLEEGLLEPCSASFVYVRRQTGAGVRKGLVAAFDLERYEFREGAKSLIRATEGTVAERLPARKLIRSLAPLEIPHALVLVNEPRNELFELLEGARGEMRPLYDFELMLGGGRIEGRELSSEQLCEKMAEILERDRLRGEGFLFAMGDGNHSFAAAKLWWDELKETLSPEQRENHPARFALAELVNLHDSALTIEPIHRLLCGVNPAAAAGELEIDPLAPPPLSVLQPRLDAYLKANPAASLDYIHGAEECLRLAAEAEDRLAIVYADFDRESIFKQAAGGGALPRKSFSLGEARDKRYYLESRLIIP